MNKGFFAGTVALCAMLTAAPLAEAAYQDVPRSAWFEEAAESMTEDGILDTSQELFRPNDTATRAEFLNLIVMLNGGFLSPKPEIASFDDVHPDAWYFYVFEESAKEQWIKGEGNCLGTHPCFARPGNSITRAEAAALIVRSYGLERTNDTLPLADVPKDQWYADAIFTTADHCVMLGDRDGMFRPTDKMNRAEMIVMLHRVDRGEECELMNEPGIEQVIATSAKTLEIKFTDSIDPLSAKDLSQYRLQTNGSEAVITAVSVLAPNVVELTFTSESVLSCGDTLTVSVKELKTEAGKTISSSDEGNFYCY